MNTERTFRDPEDIKQRVTGDIRNAYYGPALLYRMAGQMEAAQSVLETFFTRSPHLEGVERLPIYNEAKELYKEVSAAAGVRKKGH